MKNKQYFQKLLKLNRLIDPTCLTEGQRKMLEDQDLMQEYSKFILPEKWMIRNCEFVGRAYDDLLKTNFYRDTRDFKYLKSHNSHGVHIFDKTQPDRFHSYNLKGSQKSEYVDEITIEQFKRLYDEIRS